MIPNGRAAAAGLAGWAARLLFVLGLAAGAFGLYIALFASLGERDPGHEWILGLTVFGIGAGVSILGFIGAFVPWSGRHSRRAHGEDHAVWYWGTYLVLGATAVALLCLSCGLRLIGDWQRSNVTVIATASDCAVDADDSGTIYSCTYDWDWNGVHHTQNRSADAQYPDGRAVDLWIDPVTGGADEHTFTAIVYSFIGAGGIGLFDLLIYTGVGVAMYERRREFKPWLAGHAWWRPLPSDDAVPAVPPELVIEDARPPGY